MHTGRAVASAKLSGLQCLIIVGRERADLHFYLMETYGMINGFHVLLDRRQRVRRQQVEAHLTERRQAERRRPPTTEHDLRRQPFFLVPHHPPMG